jgi:hypothetical protein
VVVVVDLQWWPWEISVHARRSLAGPFFHPRALIAPLAFFSSPALSLSLSVAFAFFGVHGGGPSSTTAGPPPFGMAQVPSDRFLAAVIIATRRPSERASERETSAA